MCLIFNVSIYFAARWAWWESWCRWSARRCLPRLPRASSGPSWGAPLTQVSSCHKCPIIMFKRFLQGRGTFYKGSKFMAYMSGNNQSAVHPSREREQLKTFRDKKLLAMVRAGAGMAYLVAAPVSALGLRDRLVPTFSTFSTS